MNRLTSVSTPSLDPKNPLKYLEELQRHYNQTAVLLMRLNNEVLDLKALVEELREGQR